MLETEAPQLRQAQSEEFDKEELAALVAALPNDGWVVERVLSSSPFEVTQIVRRDKGVVENRFVRKIFTREAGLGTAYEHLFAAQTAGARFEHLPFIYDMVQVDEGIAVVTQLVSGETLQRYVAKGSSGIETAVLVGTQLCDAMEELHEGLSTPLVHRDLKPGNIMLSSGRLVLIDLGIARTWRAGGVRDTVRLGTPGYAPPEQFGYGQTTPQSDIYAAGMVVAYCFTGENPAPGLRESGFCDPRIPEVFRPVLVQATELDASRRYANARSMKAAIEQAARQLEESAAQGALDQRAIAGMSDPAEASPAATGHGAASGMPGRATTTSPARTPGAFRRFLSSIPDGVGIAWNTLLAIVWVFFFVASIGVSVTGGTEFLDRMPLWLRFIDYLGVVILPVTAIVILLADKRRLRKRILLLGHYSWLQTTFICLVVAIVSPLITLLVTLIPLKFLT